MLFEDIKHPLVSDFLTRISGSGYTYLNTESSSRINDFVKYLGSITADNGDDFAFYPLRQAQNIGIGNQIFGIGYMASGTNIVFPQNINWTESGILLNSIKNCGILNFSGKLKDSKFQFRKNETSIFYFLKHNRPKYETSLYRDGQVCPYFWFDDSLDNFGVIAPEFSTSDFRTTGTTYLYDEIYGGDKKGYQIDFSSDDPTKYNVFNSNTGRAIGTGIAPYVPPAVSFYEMDNNENKFVCINAVIRESQYSIRSFFGRDYRSLTGNFPNPYQSIEVTDPKTQEVYIDNFFPRRMVIGAGVRNKSAAGYDLDGTDHICAGILILRGDYSNKSKDIAENMAEAIGIKIRPPKNLDTTFAFGNILNDRFACSGYIASINYYDYTSPVLYKTYSDYYDIVNFTASIYSGSYIDYGQWTYNVVNSVTGELRSPQIGDTINNDSNITGIVNLIGFQNGITAPFGAFYNQGVIGFVSGYATKINNEFIFNRFTEQTESGASGFYRSNISGIATGQIFFPPIRKIFQELITGYVSGIKDSDSLFTPFDSSSNLYSSGYYYGDQVYAYPQIGIIPQKITGYISGFLSENGIFSEFDKNYLDSSSGYFYSENSYEFLPKKTITNSPVTGFLVGMKSGDYFSGYYQNTPTDGLYSGFFIDNDFSNPAEIEPVIEIYFPTGSGLFSGFSGMSGIDERLGFNFTGFFQNIFDINGDPILDESGNAIILSFDGSSGFIDIGAGPFPNTRTASCTGIIGSKNVLNFSGSFDGFNNIEVPDINYGSSYSGFFIESSGFVGTGNFGSGMFTGFIGSINILEYINLTGFQDNLDFLAGGLFTGFSFPLGSGFSGLYDNLSGTGIQTGFIGSRYYLMESGSFSGFSGFSGFSDAFLNEINIDFSFQNGSGFSGLYFQDSGYGVISGLITTGKSPLLFGDPLYFVPSILAISYGGNFTQFITGDFIFTGVIPDITGIRYLSGAVFTYAINTGSLITGDIFVTGTHPEITSLNYFATTGEDIILSGFDGNALSYIFRLEAYEGQKLESGVRVEINKFISGLKTDGIWDSITDCCLMAGPRTFSGAFVPLKGNSGIGYNFISSDYNRASGLIGDASSKYVDSNRSLNIEPSGNQHLAVYITKTGSPSFNQYYIGAGVQNVTGSSAIYASGAGALFQKSRASGIANYQNFGPSTGFMAVSRFSTGIWAARNTYISETAFVYVESGAQPANVYVFANNNTGIGAGMPEGYSDARIAIYSIGTNINILSNYENRVISYLSGIKKYV
jgi:hypothetical protein